jgi:hypothetical protein
MMLSKAGFGWLRSKGSHRIYEKAKGRRSVPQQRNATSKNHQADSRSNLAGVDGMLM